MHINLSRLWRLLSPGEKTGAKLTAEELASISNSFDGFLLSRLRGLSPASVTLAWLCSAVDVLAFAHSAVKSLVLDLELHFGNGFSSWYLDNTLKILDLCNCFSFEIQQLSLHCSKLRIAIELLQSDRNPLEEKICRARDLLADSEGEGGDGCVYSTGNIEELIRDLAVSIETSAPQGKVSPVERVVHHVVRTALILTVFVARIISAAFHASPGAVSHIHVPEDFPWGDSFRTVESAVIAELGRNREKDRTTSVLKELDGVESRARHLLEAIDEVAARGGSGETVERLREMAIELQTPARAMSDGADQLREVLDGLFETVMGIRTEMTDELAAGLWKRPSPEMPLKVSFTIENNRVEVTSEIRAEACVTVVVMYGIKK